MKSKKTIIYYLLIITGIIVLVNIISNSLFFRLDFTDDSRFTLSSATKDILKNLDQPVTVTAYFSEDLPPDVAKTRTDFKEMLIEYSSLSGGLVQYEFVNPNESDESEQKAMQAGIQPVLINSREKDQAVQKKAYLGANIQLGEENEIIPFLQPGAAMEYTLSSAIKKLSVIEKPVIGLLQGHGEPQLRQLQQVNAALEVLYSVEPVMQNDTANTLLKYSTIAIVAPKDSFPQIHLQQLDEFLANGKNLFIACDKVDGDLSTAYGSSLNTGLESWLAAKGLKIEDNFVIDANCANVSVPQRFGNMTLNTQVGFPYIPIVSNFKDHPVTKGLEAVVFQFVSSITYIGDSSKVYQPLVQSSEKAGTLSCPLYFNVSKRWQETDFPLKNLTLGAILSGKIVGSQDSKIVLFADGNFPVNGEGREMMQLQPDNVSLMVNSIDWLSDDTGLIELRTKGVTSRPIEDLEDGNKLFLKLLNFVLPILLIILYGLVRFMRNKNIRIKRMEEGYV